MTRLEVLNSIKQRYRQGNCKLNYVHLRDLDGSLLNDGLFEELVACYNNNDDVTSLLIAKLEREVTKLKSEARLYLWQTNSKGQEQLYKTFRFYNYLDLTNYRLKNLSHLQHKPFKIKASDKKTYYTAQH